jgi:hypothetical protein
MSLSPTEREVLERMAKPGHYEPYAPTMNDFPTPTHTALATRGLIQWAKAPHSSVEWEITDAGREALLRG